MEEVITISKSDLQELIAREVAKTISAPAKSIHPNTVFSDEMIRSEDIQEINGQFEWVCYLLRDESRYKNGYDKAPYSLLALAQYHYGTDSMKSTASFTDVHDYLRKLSLAIFGKSLNNQLSRYEYDFAQQVYRELKSLFLKLYEERLHLLTASEQLPKRA